MQNTGEWLKGFAFSLIFGIMFYLLWDNVFSNLINMAGTWTISGDLTSNSLSLLTTLAWISFVLLFIGCVPLYFLMGILRGSSGTAKTEPLELFKAVAFWSIGVPFALLIYIIMANLVPALTLATTDLMDTAARDLASNISWFITLFIVLLLNFLPTYYILRGYGLIGGDDATSEQIVQ